MTKDVAGLIRERGRRSYEERNRARWKPAQDSFTSFVEIDNFRRTIREVPAVLAEYPAIAPSDWVVRFEQHGAVFINDAGNLIGTDMPDLAALYFTPKPFLMQEAYDIPWFGIALNSMTSKIYVVERLFNSVQRVTEIGVGDLSREQLLLAVEKFEASLWGENPGQRRVVCRS